MSRFWGVIVKVNVSALVFGARGCSCRGDACCLYARENRKRHNESVFCCMFTSMSLLDILLNNYAINTPPAGFVGCQISLVLFTDLTIKYECFWLDLLLLLHQSPSKFIALNDICSVNISDVVRLHVNNGFTRCAHDVLTV